MSIQYTGNGFQSQSQMKHYSKIAAGYLRMILPYAELLRKSANVRIALSGFTLYLNFSVQFFANGVRMTETDTNTVIFFSYANRFQPNLRAEDAQITVNFYGDEGQKIHFLGNPLAN